MEKPIQRSKLRAYLGMKYYKYKRYLYWIRIRNGLSKEKQKTILEYKTFDHKTPLLRKLKDVDMWYQYNKVKNLRIASQKLDGLIIKPGETFSYWYTIGEPTKKKGYVEGMVLKSGTFGPGVGGGMCQMSNLIFWMTLHTPLTVIERHRHGYDVFPDSNRTQPFGSGATCYYPHVDLMIRNDTPYTFQLKIELDNKYLKGEWRTNSEIPYEYKIIEKEHRMTQSYWGGYIRHNSIYREIYQGQNLVREEEIVKNSAIMMYEPFLQAKEG